MTADIAKRKSAEEVAYALELHIRGVIHIQIERLPPVIGTLIMSAVSVLVTTGSAKSDRPISIAV